MGVQNVLLTPSTIPGLGLSIEFFQSNIPILGWKQEYMELCRKSEFRINELSLVKCQHAIIVQCLHNKIHVNSITVVLTTSARLL